MTQRTAEFRHTTRAVALQPEGTSEPLFLFPGVYGGPEGFADMAVRLGRERPVYGFRHIGASGECDPPVSIEAMAGIYAADIRALQPHGPYYLFGYSSGGATAFEVARILRVQGARIGLVIMAECLAPGFPKPMKLSRRLQVHARNLLTATHRERSAYLRERLYNGIARISKWLGRERFDEPVEPLPEALMRVNLALVKAFYSYKPTPQTVKVLFLSTDAPFDWPGALFDDPLLGWGIALQGEFARYCIPGHHRSIFEAENVEPLVERIRAALAETDGRVQRATG